jgi:putative Holliday junction resolvase
VAATPHYILALDVGSKRIGVAIASSIARLPRPLTTLKHSENIMNDILEIVSREQIGIIVVGLPRGMDGGYTEQTRFSEAFKIKLAAVTSVPVVLADETLTSVQAEAELAGTVHSKSDIDAVAACVILETYFSEHPAGVKV